MKLKTKKSYAKEQKDALYHVSKLFEEGERVYYCETLSRKTYCSVYSIPWLLALSAFMIVSVLYWHVFPLFFRIVFPFLCLASLYHIAIRVLLRPCAVISQQAFYLYLPTFRGRIYRIAFSELKSVRIHSEPGSNGPARFLLRKKKITFCNSPYWKLVRFKLFRNVSKLDSIDYASFYCYTPIFLQVLAGRGEDFRKVLTDMKKIGNVDFVFLNR